jgi:hypothetical protein
MTRLNEDNSLFIIVEDQLQNPIGYALVKTILKII